MILGITRVKGYNIRILACQWKSVHYNGVYSALFSVILDVPSVGTWSNFLMGDHSTASQLSLWGKWSLLFPALASWMQLSQLYVLCSGVLVGPQRCSWFCGVSLCFGWSRRYFQYFFPCLTICSTLHFPSSLNWELISFLILPKLLAWIMPRICRQMC